MNRPRPRPGLRPRAWLRLRVRELLILVVYGALIGQAFVLGFVEPGLPSPYLPSDVPGHVWAPASEAIDLLVLDQQGGQSLRKVVVSGGRVTITQASDSKPDLIRGRIDAHGEHFMLVPERLVK